jgi:hypothetical protein
MLSQALVRSVACHLYVLYGLSVVAEDVDAHHGLVEGGVGALQHLTLASATALATTSTTASATSNAMPTASVLSKAKLAL